ncbi:MAG: diguanylate cyclase [Proteobacteria bacterium]|nr:diguanylate cyclase [Pseudomonadota bacterium]
MSDTPDELYRRLAEAAPIGVVLVDATNPEHPLVYANQEFCHLCGFAMNELLGRNLRFLQGEDREQDARQRLRESLERGEAARVLLRNYRKDGSLFWNEMSVVPLKDAAGFITHFAGFHRDAGERLKFDPRAARDSVSGAQQPTAVAIRDDRLTGLYTESYLEELLKRDWAIAQREKRSIALFAIDIDALDTYNTTFGRAAGESAIRRVAHCVSGCLRRASDVTARVEGGNLLAFAPGIDPEQALRLANTMVERVRDMHIHHPRSTVLRYLTISVGVATLVPGANDGPAALTEKARVALQKAKKAGRNRVA